MDSIDEPDKEIPMVMPGELPAIDAQPSTREHPSWCAKDRDGIHYSREIPPWGGNRVIYPSLSLFRMDDLPVPLVGVILRLCAADVIEDYPIDLDQARDRGTRTPDTAGRKPRHDGR
ncbi:hypothetical protein O7627_23115 [Solwaraspora sp. WMMD1047]|uniref:hypothetical protein n=1 Tax=Solwaraspora sp. WMMD1047 TaxID=3016102 RepID=UPI00241794F2|nr:hypothetical protein [Solwaraspora sp. WMMD1047]MDG4832177.1 hypothetical protein [Solwaraspora sp. WMMD1047]